MEAKLGQAQEDYQSLYEDYETLQFEYEGLYQMVFDRLDGQQPTYHQDNLTAIVYIEGTDILEDGVVVVLKVIDEDGLVWSHEISDIPVTELSVHSGINGYDHQLYMVVSGQLYAFDLITC